jgi:pimeloyl-ACP methyl ester carboxylesterase
LGGNFQTVLWRPVVALGAKLFVPVLIAGVVLVVMEGTEVTPEVVGAGALIVVAGAIAGLGQAMYWRRKLGGVAYELRGDELVVVDRGALVSAWNRREVDQLRVESSVGWRDLITNSHEFPRLVVRSSGRVEECPPVLVWGSDDPTAFQAAARAWLQR